MPGSLWSIAARWLVLLSAMVGSLRGSTAFEIIKDMLSQRLNSTAGGGGSTALAPLLAPCIEF